MPRATRRYPLRSLAAVSDHAGCRHTVSLAEHNGRAIVGHAGFGVVTESSNEQLDVEPEDPLVDRLRRLAQLASSERFSPGAGRAARAGRIRPLR